MEIAPTDGTAYYTRPRRIEHEIAGLHRQRQVTYPHGRRLPRRVVRRRVRAAERKHLYTRAFGRLH